MEKTVWDVIPNVSINGIVFGTNRSTVRTIFGKPERVFTKAPNSVNTTDDYSNFHVYYSAEDRLEAIEVFSNNIYLYFNSHLLFPGTFSTAKKHIKDLEDYYGSYISKTDSIAMDIEDENIVSILIGRKDYYKFYR